MNRMDIELKVTSACEEGTKDGTPFFYKASSAKCLKGYVEYNSNEDCQNAANPITNPNDQTFPFLIGDANKDNYFEKRCGVKGSDSFRTTCGDT